LEKNASRAEFFCPLKDKQEMISHLRAAVERGITFLDIADAYSCFVLAVEETVLIDPCVISASILHRSGP
jgi:hypothetical protein